MSARTADKAMVPSGQSISAEILFSIRSFDPFDLIPSDPSLVTARDQPLL
jgi:hypothetical protein